MCLLPFILGGHLLGVYICHFPNCLLDVLPCYLAPLFWSRRIVSWRILVLFWHGTGLPRLFLRDRVCYCKQCVQKPLGKVVCWEVLITRTTKQQNNVFYFRVSMQKLSDFDELLPWKVHKENFLQDGQNISCGIQQPHRGRIDVTTCHQHYFREGIGKQ